MKVRKETLRRRNKERKEIVENEDIRNGVIEESEQREIRKV
jgi:hypothetical protein